jgi:hypothetical protein
MRGTHSVSNLHTASAVKGARVCAEVVGLFAAAKVLVTGVTLIAVVSAGFTIAAAAAFGFAVGYGASYLMERPRTNRPNPTPKTHRAP